MHMYIIICFDLSRRDEDLDAAAYAGSVHLHLVRVHPHRLGLHGLLCQQRQGQGIHQWYARTLLKQKYDESDGARK